MHTAMRSVRSSSLDLRGRRGLTAQEIVMLAMLGVLIVAATLCVAPPAAPTQVQTQSHLMLKGQSLWSVATRYPVPGLDTAATVDLIVELNGLESPMVCAGTTIRVPLAAATDAVAMR